MNSTKKTFVLDPGHGLNSKGEYQRPLMDCRGTKAIIVPNSMQPHSNDNQPGFYREDHGTLAIAKRVAAELECMGHKVFLTRKDNTNALGYLSAQSNNAWKKANWKAWKWIKEFADQKKADVFVSIHTNAGGGSGSVAFWAEPTKGMDLCNFLVQEINNQLGIKNKSVRKKRYLVLRDTCKGKACLLECLFHDNINDIKLLLTQHGINKMAEAIAIGLDKFAQTF